MANNSSGARSVLYGKTIDHVLEQEVVLSDGSVVQFRPLIAGGTRSTDAHGESLEAECYRTVRRIAAECADEVEKRFPKVLRRVGGYNLDEFTQARQPFNLAKLMVGSEGTLGVVLEAKLNLVPLPKAKAVLAIQFAELLEALAATPVILQHRPSAVEVMDKFILDHTRQSLRARTHSQQLHPGRSRRAAVCRVLRRCSRTTCRRGIASARAATSSTPTRLSLPSSVRTERSGAHLEPARSGARPVDGDEGGREIDIVRRRYRRRPGAICAITSSGSSASFSKHETTAGIYAHASVGCLHVRPVVNLKTEQGIQKFEAIANEVADLVLEFGGALSGEHGDGLVRSPFMRKMFGPVLYEAFRDDQAHVRSARDLQSRQDRRRSAADANLRFGAGYKTPNPTTYFDYSDYGGMGGAVEMCSGLGACRKKLEGTMCPSYMATLEEAHSTRGRANILRLAMAGRLGESGLGDEGVYDVLDLCLECRACKAECPVGVDVARFKSEFLADYWARHGTPLHARALGTRARDREVGQAAFAPIANCDEQVCAGVEATERASARHRPAPKRCPAWSGQTFHRLAVKAATTRNADVLSLQRHLHELLRSRNRHGRDGMCSSRRLLSPGTGGQRVLRPSADLERPAGAGARASAREHRCACTPQPNSGQKIRLLRTELPVGSP